MKSDASDATEQFERALSEPATQRYVLRLYVAGVTPRSTRSIIAIKEICRQQLAERYDLEVIDLYQRPELAREHEIIAVPTLIKQLPLPLRRMVGDLSGTERVLVGMGLEPREG